MATTKEIGDIGESAAVKILKRNGYKIVARNKRFSHNEIDIIAEDESYIAFVEVKTRTADSTLDSPYGPPSAAVTRAKQTRLIKAAQEYLKKYPTGKQPRMDVFEIWLDKNKKVLKTHHILNAYGK